MLVKEFMTPTVITVREDQSMLEAREIMSSKALLSLPVIDDLQRVRGIITRNDIGNASPSDASTLSRYEANYLLGRLKVKDVMSRNVITVNGDDSIEYVAYQLYKHRVNALPVVDDNNKLCGIIAQNDIFRAFVEIMSMDHNCTRITLEAEDQIGVVADISNMFKDNNINIYSMITRLIDNGKSEITIRADLSGHGLEIVEQLREAGYNVTDIMTINGIN